MTEFVLTGGRACRAGWMRQTARQRHGAEPAEINVRHCSLASQSAALAVLLGGI